MNCHARVQMQVVRSMHALPARAPENSAKELPGGGWLNILFVQPVSGVNRLRRPASPVTRWRKERSVPFPLWRVASVQPACALQLFPVFSGGFVREAGCVLVFSCQRPEPVASEPLSVARSGRISFPSIRCPLRASPLRCFRGRFRGCFRGADVFAGLCGGS